MWDWYKIAADVISKDRFGWKKFAEANFKWSLREDVRLSRRYLPRIYTKKSSADIQTEDRFKKGVLIKCINTSCGTAHSY